MIKLQKCLMSTVYGLPRLRKSEVGSRKASLNQSGQIFLLVLVALGVVLFTVLSIVAGAQLYYQNSFYSLNAEKATALAEAGVDKALSSLNITGGSYNGETETVLGEGSYSVAITTQDAGTKIIQSTGYIPSKVKAKAKRTIKITSSRGIGAAFVYGVQIGEGGLTMKGGNSVRGSIYSNGDIIVTGGGSENEVIGDVWVAGAAAATADQQTDCDGSNCTDYIFGRSVSGESRLDIAQSFRPSITKEMSKVSIKLKKIGSPPDLTVRILGDNSGKPNKNDVKATGTLYSSLVTTSYGWIDVTFDLTPILSANTTYWLMLHASSSNTNYWSWQNDLAKSYTCGNPDLCFGMWSPDWSVHSPVWTAFNGDLSFKVFLGGFPTKVDGADNLDIQGNVHANTIKDVEIDKDAYYQTLISSSVHGASHPASEDPPPKVFPISDANVAEWKNVADAGGTIAGFSNCPTQILSQKIEGDVELDGCHITIKSPIWITGNLILENNNILTLSSEYGATSGVIVIDGRFEMKNGNHFNGTGTGNSLLMVLSNYDSRSNGLPAVDVKNNGNSGVFYAANGIISPGNGNTFKELTAWKIDLVQNSTIDYETGLSSTLFSSGPSGTYSLVKGTYQTK